MGDLQDTVLGLGEEVTAKLQAVHQLESAKEQVFTVASVKHCGCALYVAMTLVFTRVSSWCA